MPPDRWAMEGKDLMPREEAKPLPPSCSSPEES